MKIVKRLLTIFSLKTGIITVLAVFSTYLCRKYNLVADFPLTLITMAVVFPIVFSIGGAYKRRESALDDYSSMKAHGRAIYFAARDWPENSDADAQKEIRTLLGNLLEACRKLFMAKIKDMPDHEDEVYRTFSKISRFIKGLRAKGLSAGEASRCNQYLSKMIIAFENVKHIYQYRTPKTLRAYSDVFIVVLPILYGPYFAEIAGSFSNGLEYLMPVLLSVILVSLDNIQGHLENPFDQVGEDDVMINVEKYVSRLEL